LAVLATVVDRPAAAQADAPWRVEGKLIGKTKNGDQKKSEDISGIACLPVGLPRKCLVIDDEVQFAQIVIVNDGELLAGDTIPLVTSPNDGQSLDGEGVAFAKGAFYFVGSHGHPRDRKGELDPVRDRAKIEASMAASSKLIRLKIDSASITNQGKVTAPPSSRSEVDLRPLIRSQAVLAPLKPFLGQRLEEQPNGLTIEGLAAVKDRLYVGLRAPVLDGDHAVVVSFAQDAPFDGQPLDLRLDRLRLGPKRGVRDLAAWGSGLLVLAGPAYEPKTAKNGDYSIYAWDRDQMLVLLRDLPAYEADGEVLKPEALLPLKANADGTLDVLVLFDAAKEGGPRLIKVPK
jgi:hypothetical protein